MNATTKYIFQVIGWSWVFVFVMIGVLGAGMHVVDHFNFIADRPAVANFLQEYLYGKEFFEHWIGFRAHPGTRMLHMVTGIIFVLIAPLQLMPWFRVRFPRVHRMIGRTCLVFSAILIGTGIVFAFRDTYTGFYEQVPTVTYSIIYAWIVFMAMRNILAGNVSKHREWMIRGFAMMMGISATRVWFYIFLKVTDLPSTTFFSSIFWLGLGVNLMIGEIWINMTRPQFGSKHNTEREAQQAAPIAVTQQSLPRPRIVADVDAVA